MRIRFSTLNTSSCNFILLAALGIFMDLCGTLLEDESADRQGRGVGLPNFWRYAVPSMINSPVA